MDRLQILELLRERIVAFAASRYQRDFAEDVAQEVLIVLHQKYEHVTEIQELVPLALQIARFKIKAGVRKSVRRGEHEAVSVDETPLPDPGPDPGELIERKLTLERLRAVLANLGDRCRDLLRYKLEGRSFSEIQKLFKVDSINTIYTWDHRCRKELKEAMGGKWEASHER